jgi:hypothetical protein
MSWVWHKPGRKVKKPQWDKAPADPSSEYLEYVYAWERRCRGYDLFARPVALEPAWISFDSAATQTFDPSSLSALAGGSSSINRFSALRLPTEQKVSPQSVSEWIQSLSGFPASFEIVGSHHEILYQLGMGEGSFDHASNGTGSDSLSGSLATHFPLAEIEDEDDALRRVLAPLRGRPVGYGTVDFGLLHLAYQPLQRWSRFAFDPLSSLVNALGQLGEGEIAGLQVLFAPARQAWSAALQRVAEVFSEGTAAPSRSALNPNGSLAQASAKTGSPLFAVAVRVFAVSRNGNALRSDDQAAFDLCRRLGQCLSPFSVEGGNAFLALDKESYDEEDHFRDLLARQTRRHGMLLSLDELVGLVHPPCETLQHPKLVRPVAGEEPLPPHLLEAQGALIGLHPYRQQEQKLVWPDEFRNRHAYLLGATRMGKSTLMLNLIARDLEAGRGLCLIDPHGDLAKDVLALVPPERVNDTLYLDFADREHPPAIGLLQAGDEWEARLLCSDLLSILRRLFASSWGDRLEHILRHVLLTLLADQEHSHTRTAHTLRDIRPLLSDKAYRARVLESVSDLDLQAFWRSEFPTYGPATFSPIYNKLGLLLSSPIVRNIVAQPESKLQLGRIMGGNQILLVNLNQSLVGEDNAHFLGALLVSKLQIAAMQSLRKERTSRVPFTLYVDEFQNFVVSSFEKILSEAGKAGLSLVMANQFIEQLPQGLQSAIWGNVGTLVSFRVSGEGGRLLEKELASKFRQSDMVSLNRGEAVARIGQARDSFFIRTLPPPSSTRTDSDFISAIVERTREQCCRPRAEVEAELAAKMAMSTPTEDAPLESQPTKGPQSEEVENQSQKSDTQQTKAATRKKPRTKKLRAKKIQAKKRSATARSKGASENRDEDARQTLEVEDAMSEEESGLVGLETEDSYSALIGAERASEPEFVNNLSSVNLEPECFGVPDDEPPLPMESSKEKGEQ